jgi:membrane-bound metal-dependent hydrolase YbcI (DUF457 family)
LAFSSALGAGYGALGVFQLDLDWGPVCLGAGLTALGGMLPDLDSDSSVPAREVFSLAATVAPFMLMHKVAHFGFSPEQTLAILCGVYLLIRYGVRAVFEKLTVHRGMFHSLPAMLIAGLIVFQCYHSPNNMIRLYLAVGVMLGFLSHLVLDALYGVDLMGAKLGANKHGGPLKLFSPSWLATITTYLLLAGLAYPVYVEFNPSDTTWQMLHDQALKYFSAIHK